MSLETYFVIIEYFHKRYWHLWLSERYILKIITKKTKPPLNKIYLRRANKILRNVERKEKFEKQKDPSIKMFYIKTTNSDESYENIKIAYPTNSKQSEFSSEEDQFLIFLTSEHGYGNWEEIIRAIRLSDDFMFNYYLKSRDKGEIQKRIDYLVKVLEREVNKILKNI